MDFHELYENKKQEMREKYADVINDLSVKYNVDLGVALDYLEAIAKANLDKEEVLYVADVEYNMVELIRDYAELRYYSNNCL